MAEGANSAELNKSFRREIWKVDTLGSAAPHANITGRFSVFVIKDNVTENGVKKSFSTKI